MNKINVVEVRVQYVCPVCGSAIWILYTNGESSTTSCWMCHFEVECKVNIKGKSDGRRST